MSMTGDYPNRSDLRNPATSTARFTGQTYGQASQQARSQRAVRPGVSPATRQAQQMAGEQPQGQPVQRPRAGAQPFNRPTERPNEPLTAGASFGPGPTRLDNSVRPRTLLPSNDVLDRLTALYNMFPNDQLRVLIQRMMER
jgi:hypothetical protein